MKYIDAEKLIAEIHKHIGKYDSMLHEWSIPVVKGKREEAFSILTMVETLHQEQPEVDLEKEIKEQWKKWDDIITYRAFASIARHFYERGFNARNEE